MSSFLKALEGVNQGPPPIWFMRQAGRYLPSYQALRAKHSLLKMFHSPQLAHEVTLLPFEVLDLDAAIIFSDILVIFEALGFKVDYPQVGGPQVIAPSTVDEILGSIKHLDIASTLSYVFESIIRVKPDLKVPLLGFSATPFTLLAYLLEKPMNDEIKTVKKALYETPQSVHALLNILTHLVIAYADLQIQAGIDAFQLFDTASTWLSSSAFCEFSLPYTRQVLEHLKKTKSPTLLFSKSSSARLGYYASLPLNGLSVDWTADIKTLRQGLPNTIALQGNLDPYLTTLEFEMIEHEVRQLIDQTQQMPHFIFNLGHGVVPQTRLKTLQAIIKHVKASSYISLPTGCRGHGA
jgi:uroporphyrinogen decarboxylase